MKQLKLEHLAPYLPYGLNFYIEHADGTPLNPWVMTIDTKLRQVIEFQNKPILRPLSDLTDGKIQEYFVGCDLDVTRDKAQIIINFSKYNQWKEERINLITHVLLGQKERHLPMSVGLYKWLLKHHFDVFGLIDQGLAIDINTLEK